MNLPPLKKLNVINILVTGANDQLGNEMRIVSKASKDYYVFTDVIETEGQETTILDITDMDAIRKMEAVNKIKIIVNCAAYTNVDKAEIDQDTCELLNTKAPENLAIAMKVVDEMKEDINSRHSIF